MSHILINGDNAPLCAKALTKNEVKFTEFNEKCDECGLALDESACIEGNAVKCGGCGKKYPIIDTTKSGNTGKEKNMSKPEPKAEKAKTVKPEPNAVAKPAKVEKAVKPALKPKVEAKSAPAKAERKPREGSLTNTVLVATDKAETRDGGGSAFVMKFFKKPTTPAKVLEKMITEWKADREQSETFKKSPRGYCMWYILHMIRKGGLKKA
jgi:DNA-directed RNA polymerase subunit M/transcription elongation factor TFIIS